MLSHCLQKHMPIPNNNNVAMRILNNDNNNIKMKFEYISEILTEGEWTLFQVNAS